MLGRWVILAAFFRNARLSDFLSVLADKRFLALVCLIWQAFFDCLSRHFFERSFVALLLFDWILSFYSFLRLGFLNDFLLFFPFIFGASGGQGGQGGLRVPPMPSLDSPITPL